MSLKIFYSCALTKNQEIGDRVYKILSETASEVYWEQKASSKSLERYYQKVRQKYSLTPKSQERFDKKIEALKKRDVLVAVLQDGASPYVLIGVAYMLEKPYIAIIPDIKKENWCPTVESGYVLSPEQLDMLPKILREISKHKFI
jgi:hypothetical protein